jgi:hypothetical protein
MLPLILLNMMANGKRWWNGCYYNHHKNFLFYLFRECGKAARNKKTIFCEHS